VKLAFGKLQSMDIVAAVQDFDFLGGSLGMAAGEAIITGMTAAIERHTPFIIFTASGGARMQEGIFSLMQMPRTTIAVQRLRDAKLPYIVVLTNPTTGVSPPPMPCSAISISPNLVLLSVLPAHG